MIDSILPDLIKALVVFLATAGWATAKKLYRDLNAVFKKIRLLEKRVAAIEEGDMSFKPKLDPPEGARR